MLEHLLKITQNTLRLDVYFLAINVNLSLIKLDLIHFLKSILKQGDTFSTRISDNVHPSKPNGPTTINLVDNNMFSPNEKGFTMSVF